VKLFARARELAGAETVSVQVPAGSTVADLRSALLAAAPSLSVLSSSLFVAVDGVYASDEMPLDDVREVACFPPVSGG